MDGTRDRRYFNRELSWLLFNERVLALAEDDFTPLLERAKFLAIFATNLDEFFQVRVGGLKRQLLAGVATRSPDGLTPAEQLEAIAERVVPLARRHAALFCEDVWPALNKAGIEVTRWKELNDDTRGELNELFADQIFPVVTPLAVDPGRPFPYISNLSLNLAVLVNDPDDQRSRFARVKVPPLLSRFVAVASGEVFVPIEDVIAANLDRLFPGMEVIEHHAFRVTRNADFEVDDDGADDLLEALEEELSRRRVSPSVRLEIELDMPVRILDLLVRELHMEPREVHTLPGPLDLSGLWALYGLDRPDLKDPPFQSKIPAPFHPLEDQPADIFAVLDQQDVLVHHPYEPFTNSVQRFIEQAAADPDVLAIKQTLYRTSGESPIVDALMEAAEAGKQVVVLVEIKARFDELANINWARTLEQAGCHVVYGLVGLKTHCKLCLVVRRHNGKLQRYIHAGTGNYNPRTARLYEDLGLLTSDDHIGADASDLFNYLTGYSRRVDYKTLIVAPHGMRARILAMIEREAAASTPENPGRIIMKVNNLVDEQVIDALYAASKRNVKIDLIVRSICALRPGLPELSDNISVRSILGRFLEHSRILYFANGGNEQIYIGSADLMHRNLDRRVEAFVSVRDEDIKARVKSILDLALADNSSAWSLDTDGVWRRVAPAEGERWIALQEELVKNTGRDD